MSENPVQNERGPRVLDFTGTTVIGLPGGAGIVSINADATPAQVITDGTGIAVSSGPPGTTTITNSQPFFGGAVSNNSPGAPINALFNTQITLASLTNLDPGVYVIIGQVQFNLVLSANGEIVSGLQLNAATFATESVWYPLGFTPSHSLSGVITIAALADLVELTMIQRAGASEQITTGPQTVLQAVRIA